MGREMASSGHDLTPEPPAAIPSSFLKGRILILLMLISAGQQFHRSSLAAVGPRILDEYSINEEALGWLFTAFLITYTALMAPGGWLADRIGTWWTLLLVMGGSSLFEALTGLVGLWARSAQAFFVGIVLVRGGMGVCAAPIYPSTARTISHWFRPREQVWANSLVIGAALLGFSLASSNKGMEWLDRKVGWRNGFVVAAVATGVIALLWGILGAARPDSRRGGSRPRVDLANGKPSHVVWAKIIRHRGIIALTLSYSTIGYFEYMLFYWLKTYFEKVVNLPRETSAFYSSLPTLTMMVTTPLGGVLCSLAVRRWGLRRGMRGMVMASMALGSLSLAAGAVTSNLEPKVAAFCVALGFIGACEGPFWTAAVRLGGAHGGASGGFVNTGGNLLGTLAPWATPAIAVAVNKVLSAQGSFDPSIGWSASLITGGVICLAGALFWLWVDVEKPLS